MAQLNYRANLQQAAFPLLSELGGRTILIPQLDQVYVPGVNASGAAQVDRGIPGIIYAHNIMPSTYGLQSVGYNLVTPLAAGIGENGKFRNAMLIQESIRDPDNISLIISNGKRTYISLTGSGTNQLQVIDTDTGQWKIVSNAGDIDVPVGAILTVGTVNGKTYIYISKLGCFIYLADINTLKSIDLVGLDESSLIGIVASNGFLLAYTETEISWSSTVDVEDFTPSDISDAGGGAIQEARGQIVVALKTGLGFIIYTTQNAVSGAFSGNTSFPWIFREISSAGGVANQFMVGQESSGNVQQAYTTNGLQQIAFNGSTTVLPAVTDFLAGRIFEDFNNDTNQLQVTRLVEGQTLRKQIATVSDRYLVISYGLHQDMSFTHAVVIDTIEGRYGKLKISHEFAFELRNLQPEIVETPRESIAFLKSSGEIFTVDFTAGAEASDSVLIYGKLQYVRSRMLQLEQLEIENLGETPLVAYALPSLNGKDFLDPVEGYLMEASYKYNKFLFDVVGLNHSFLLKGSMNLVSLVPWFSVHGRD